MGNYEQLKQAVSDVIKANGNQEITGAVMQSVLLSIISTIGSNSTFAGIATPATNPGTPDQNVFYIACQKGTYNNFGGTILDGNVFIFENKDNKWNVYKTDIALSSEVEKNTIKLSSYFGIPINTYLFTKDIKNGYNIIENDISLEVGKNYIIMLKNEAKSVINFWGNKGLGNTLIAKINVGEMYAEFLYDKNYTNKQIQSSENNTIFIIEKKSKLLEKIAEMELKLNETDEKTSTIEKEIYGDSSVYPTNQVKINSQYTSVKSYVEQGLIYKFKIIGTFTKAVLYGNKSAGGLATILTFTPQNNTQTIKIPIEEQGYFNFQFDTKGYSSDTYVYITQQADEENKGLKSEVEKIKKQLTDISIDTENVINNLTNDENDNDSLNISLVRENSIYRNESYITLKGANVYDVVIDEKWEGRYIDVKVSKPQYGFLQSFIAEDNTVIGTFDAGINYTRVLIPIKAKILRLSNLTSNLSEPLVYLPKNDSVYTSFENVKKESRIIDGYLNMMINDRMNKSYLYDYKWGEFDKTVFVFVGDDGPKNLGQIYNVFHEKSVPLCVAIITITGDGLMRDTNYTLLEICKKIEEEGGEVLAHPHDKNITGNESFEDLLVKIKETKQYFLNYGFQSRGIIAVGAGITGNEKLDRALRGNFEFSDHYGLLTSEAYNYKNPDGGYGRSWIKTWGNTIDEIKQKIDTFSETPQLIVVGMHNYDMSSPDIYPKNEDPETIGQVIDYIKSKDNCVIMSYSKAYDTYAKRK